LEREKKALFLKTTADAAARLRRQEKKFGEKGGQKEKKKKVIRNSTNKRKASQKKTNQPIKIEECLPLEGKKSRKNFVQGIRRRTDLKGRMQKDSTRTWTTRSQGGKTN